MPRIISLLSLLLLAALLAACSAVKLAYNQAPDLAYWYLDHYLDFNGAQSVQVKEDLEKLQTWHRRTQLPAYIDTLQRLKQQMPGDVDAGQACEAFADVRGKAMVVFEQAQAAVSQLAGTLSAEQLALLERRFAKGDASYREDFMEASPEASRKKRYKQAVKRARMLYGRLDDRQEALIAQAVDQSRFDAARSYAERLRRQRDALQAMRMASAARQTGGSAAESASMAVRAVVERSLNSPDAAYRDYLDALTRDGCRNFAALHNSTSAAQRNHAVQVMTGYERDLKALLAPKS